MLNVSALTASHTLYAATVLATERGCATRVVIQHHAVCVTGQADHIGYLHSDDRVICALIDSQYYLIARLLTQDSHPAYLWQQTSDDRISLSFGRATVSLTRTGQVIVANEKASLCLDDEGHYQTRSQTFSVNSFNHIHIETLTGSIYCQYPELAV